MTDLVRIEFQCPDMPALELPRSHLLGVVQPRRVDRPRPAETVINEGLAQPIGGPRLWQLAARAHSALVLVDDNTRLTPTRAMLPLLLEELAAGGLRDGAVRLLVAAGTHRPMTEAEKGEKYGPEICRDYEVLDHRWDDEGALVAGRGAVDIPVTLNRAVLEAELLLGVGHIVPHLIAGFSGGGKIVQPGVCGAATTAATHWHATRYDMEAILGVADNPVRRQVEAVAQIAGLAAIVNAVQDAGGALAQVVVGDPVQAHRAGASLARALYGAELPGLADIAVADAYPADIDVWQATKAVCVGGLAVRRGGVVIVVSSCPEGVSPEHPELAEYGFRAPDEIRALVAAGQILDRVAAAEMAFTGRVVAQKATCILVSSGVGRDEARQLGFLWASTPQEALEMAYALVRSAAPRITVLRHAGEILPLYSGCHGNMGSDKRSQAGGGP